MLRSLTTSLSRGDSSASGYTSSAIRTYTPPSMTESSPTYEEVSLNGENEQTFEGNSSMTAHTAFASEFLEKAVTNTPLSRHLSPNIENALASLRQMVQMQQRKDISQESTFAHQKTIPKGGVSQLPLPPTDVVLKLLREIKVNPPTIFILSCTFLTVESFIEYCRRVYFATEDYGPATFIIVNAGLYYAFQEKSFRDEANSQEYREYHHLCRDNLETALANLPLLLPSNKETIEALLLGVTYAIEVSKFTLGWQLNSAAAAMCQTLGWHRLQATEDEKTHNTKLATFWFCYMLDKGLSLRFGRTSVMQDWDISTPRRFHTTHHVEPWTEAINLWIKTGGVMGETYEHLYSPAALARQPGQRIETASLLVAKMKQLWNELQGFSTTLKRQDRSLVDTSADGGIKGKEWRTMSLAVVLKSAEVSHWASLTLVYRAIPSAPGFPSTFNTECIDAARGAFSAHEECMKLTADNLFVQAGYLHWTILYSPFTPFIVLFCHVIETCSADDLQRLESFTTTLQPALHMSRGIEKLHRLCKLLSQVAALYVEAKMQPQGQEDQDMMTTVGNDFDMYLSQLGFISQPNQQHSGGGGGSSTLAGGGGEYGLEEGGAGGGGGGANGTAVNIQPPGLGDWFSGNRYVMGLMEEDMLDFDFDPEAWTSTTGAR
ncbi:uncharacterized protein Z520_05990 [Fonsecaea multimorphosa CBS 102226]|uniref:Xylanolytic transcriptional activator regulatory domain-containing protein n=1 Tax=Fonsecaea multimorphosa CBS 102226 TaxID=1442371 RepID=A0A0D2K671_9EURO|nr:uncharacterized protein Z520_05990 [Fonsecaea multimorphosa CBS 102226]KIX98689.1 hypothetical protein Z520_05990 [Fonsecaea multimorphosa CBS 102226]OAL24873.1 hypothetical protein AYO22_05662 [Fonsecaea multimorphosa]